MAKKATASAAQTATEPHPEPRPEPRQVRHPIKAAALLYSAPGFVLRGPIYVMFISLISMFIYACIATTDTLVTAPLKLQRQTVTIQAIGGGLIDNIEVSENSVVRNGSAIATIQEKIRAASTPEQEAINREERDINERKLTLTRDYDHRRSQSDSQITEFANKQITGLGSLQDRLGQLQNQLARAERSKANIQQDIATADSNRDRLEPLCARRDIPITQCEQARQRVSELQRALNNAQTDIENSRLSLDTTQRELKQLKDPGTLDRMKADQAKAQADYDNQIKLITDRLADLAKRRTDAQTLVPGVHYEGDKAVYTSTKEGIVTTVHVQRGQLIDPGKPIVTIVRDAAPLMARLLVQNKDIGQLKRGQDVKLKYFAYPFQEYGIQNGSIAEISTRPSNQPGEESLYVVDVALANESVHSRTGVDKSLEIGLQGIAEIKTGERRFIEILFAPAQKFFRAAPEKSPPATEEASPAERS